MRDVPVPSLPEDLEEAVLAILDGDEGERDRALAELLAAHPAHATAVRNWLITAGALDGDTTIAPPPAEGEAPQDPGRDDPLPRRIGAYLLDRVIGRGGFGTVYRAEQQEPIQRRVAVKVLNPGMDSREILARFAAEREALNRLDHPGIARLIDAGQTSRGRPFFVMELVEGPTLIRYCRQEQLGIRDRIALFLLVCDAMQYAHQKAVLHRDLSSGNVLVSTAGDHAQPKIIDFGIAKSLADPLLQGGAMTFQGTLMGTPEFMSPEQAAGRSHDIDTRADVYSLGVQLFELLTDQLPIPAVVLRAQGIAGMAKVVASYAPPAPSAVAPPHRRARLRGDLDNIVQKAIAKDRDDRYATVGELAADLRRHLGDQPVHVVPPTVWYRLRKYVRRHRGQAAVLAVAACGLITALIGMALALREAGRQAELAREAERAVHAKADAGFRLLANEDRLARAAATHGALPPPWPGGLPAYDRWLAEFGRPLLAERTKVQERLDQLRGQPRDPNAELRDEVERHLEHALLRLSTRLDEFAAAGGPFQAVERRRDFGRDVIAPALVADAASWAEAHEAIVRSDGMRAAKRYAGLQLPAQPGLRPLGMHPRTGLWEFLDLASHGRDTACPERDPETGQLRVDADTGVVFVLLPMGTITPGARTDTAGLDRYDRHARDDELGGEMVMLEPFLLARCELTVGQWARLRGEPPPPEGAQLPLTAVDWRTAVATLAVWGMALPTEGQWEFACRGDGVTPWTNGDDPARVGEVGWFASGLHPGAQLPANAFGLFDLHGNVAEWCRDEPLPYADHPARRDDGLRARRGGPDSGMRAVRGGSWLDDPIAARVTARSAAAATARLPGIGVRPARRLVR